MTRSEAIRLIHKEIENLPPIPENLSKIQKMIDDPRSDVSVIASYVEKDVSLTANVLRIANSPLCMPVKRVDSVIRGVTLIGLTRLNSIILSLGAVKVMNDRFKQFRELWKHSHKCAYFAKDLMRMHKVKPDIEEVELAYLSGLLHDMGKAVLLSLSPKLLTMITEIHENKKVSVEEIEKTALGMSHAEIGAKIAEKWDFPQPIIESILHHHSPVNVNQHYQPLVYTIYLSNILCKYDDPIDTILFEIDKDVREFFQIKNEKMLLNMMENLLLSWSGEKDFEYLK